MNLLYDLTATQPFGNSKRHGGGKYGEVVFNRMLERNISLICFYDSRKWLNPNVKDIIEKKNIRLLDVNDVSVEQIIKDYQIDRLYSCLPGNLAKITSCEVYGTVHGLRTYETPQDKIFWKYNHSLRNIIGYILRKYFSRLYYTHYHKKDVKRYINSNFHLITVSEHSKYAWMIYFPEIAEKEFKVFYSPYTGLKNEVYKQNPNDEKYFLVVSANVWSKNVIRAIEAFDNLLSLKLVKNIKMKVTGVEKNVFKYKIKNPEKIDFLGFVDEEELEYLYANAFVFIYPSLNEGFGAPPTAAMRYGVPVIASSFSAISEICGSGALYFNPFQIEEIMNRMLMMMDSIQHDIYSKKAREQYKQVRARQDRDLELLIDYITQ